MADNIELNAGSGGATLATDDVSGVHYQVVKLAMGSDGLAALVSNSNPIPVSDGGASLTVDGTVAVSSSALPSGAATASNQTTIIGHLDGVETLLTAIDSDTSTLAGAVSGTEMQVDVVGALPAGNNNIGDVDIASIAAGTNAIGNVGLIGRASGGLSIFRSLDIDESEEEVKNSAGTLYFIHAVNLTASPLYLKFYNATAANVTVGTTTPVLTFPIPSQGDTNGAGFTVSIPQGLAFGTAITVACTTGLADSDTGAPGANACVINLGYQ